MAAGSELAHALAFHIVYPETHVRLRELLATGHGYTSAMPLFLGLGGAMELVALAAVVAGGVRHRGRDAVPPWAFALLPMLGFTLQEFLERLFVGAGFPWWMVLQPTFRIGLLLQLPVALVVFVVARLLLRVADRAGAALRTALRRPRLAAGRIAWAAAPFSPPHIAVLATGHAGRGPPRAALAAAAA
ncbi:MAG TPA: hypothetical protein VII51_03870 [Gaiellaceae bacterium]